MGFLHAVQQMGQSEKKEGLEPYLVRPMDKDGKEIRVWLKVNGELQEILDVVGVIRMDVADYRANAVPLKKYLYKKPPSYTTSSFSPIHLAGKMKKDADKNRAAFCPPQWEEDKNKGSHFLKMKTRILDAYEREKVFTTGSVDRIFEGMQEKIDMVLPDLDNKHSYMVVFVIDDNGYPLYPGEVPALEKFFAHQLEQSLSGKKKTVKNKTAMKGKALAPTPSRQNCSLCGVEMTDGVTLNKAFKFATFDKINVVPGLDKNEIPYSFSICRSCLEQIASGREKVDRVLTKRDILGDILVWAVPEAAGSGAKELFESFLHSWEERLSDSEIAGTGEQTEEKYFSRLAKTGQGLLFHFIFWESKKSAEIVHLMVEDVPPERLARLETAWRKVTREYAAWTKNTDLDVALRSLYSTLNAFAGKSDADKRVLRDYALKVIGSMLQGDTLPVDMFKQLIIPRLPRLVYGGNASDAALSMRYAELWVEYMHRLNQEVSR